MSDAALDEPSVRRLVVALERAAAANALARAKHARSPELVAPSEVALHDAVGALAPLATETGLYGAARDAGVVRCLGGLLAHENVDIVSDVLALLVDFVDPDGEEDDAPQRAFVGALVEGGVMAGVVAVVRERLAGTGGGGGEVVDADDAATLASAALAAMSVFENAAELRPDLAGRLGRECGLVALCVEEVREGAGFSERCAAAAEVLALLLQSDLGNREALWEAGGMEVVLAAVAPYRRVAKIATGDEAEMAANMFCVLCAGLLECEANKEAFGRAEGVELMLLFVKKRRALREAALKALDFACSGCVGNTKRVFEGSGLGVLFAVLMTLWTSVDKEAQGMRDGRKRRRLMGPTETQRSEAERVLSVLFSLYRYGGDEEKARLTAKFLEAGGAKAGQLLVVYADRLDEALRVATTTESFLDVIDVMDPSEAFVMQLCAVVVACVCVAAGGAMGTAFETALGAVGGLGRVSLLVEQFGKGIDEDCNPAERDRIFALANSVGAFAAKSPVENETPGGDATVATGIATGESVHADTAGNHGVGAI